jgi:hypothetical protein
MKTLTFASRKDPDKEILEENVKLAKQVQKEN